MRVIAGSARGTILKTVEGLGTRPTTDRIKETLFNMIQKDIYDSLFLDLFSGSGAIGIEALSRGAKRACFVEQDRKAAGCIRENLKKTRLEKRASLMEQDVIAALKKMNGREECFDFIFMDPPYRQNLEFRVLEELGKLSFVDENTQIIVEASKETSFDALSDMGFVVEKRKEYKTNQHIFIRKR